MGISFIRASMNSTINVIPLSHVSVQPVERLTTAVPYVDWCFGNTTDSRGHKSWGLPAGALTLMSGASGSGKSRLAVKVAAAMTRAFHRILYAQSEVTLAQFKGWVIGNKANSDNFLVTQTIEVEELTAMIADLRPTLVVIDSISMFAGSAKQNVMALKRAVEGVHGHGLLLSHENARGHVRGGTTLPHLVDCVAKVTRSNFPDTWVSFELGKNRFGPSGRGATFDHEAAGLTPVCVSDSVHPMSQIRFDPMTGEAYRQVPRYGTGQTVEIDEAGKESSSPARRFLSRLLGR